MSTTDPFLAMLPRVIVDINCSRSTHQLVWSKGTFTTLDHVDPDGERTLSALGGTTSTCIDVLNAWNRHCDDLRMLVLTSRGQGDQMAAHDPNGMGLQIVSSQQYQGMSRRRSLFSTATSRMVSGSSTGWFGSSHVYSHHHGEEEQDDESILLGLPAGLPDRLAAEVISRWTQRLRANRVDQARLPALEAAVYGRAIAALETWLRLGLDVELTLIDDDDVPSLSRTTEVVGLRLSFGWLNRVWAPGLAITAGSFVLDARLEGNEVSLLVVAPDGGEPSTMTLARG